MKGPRLSERTPPGERGAELDAIGRAKRFRLKGGGGDGLADPELWILPADAEPIALRLLELGESSVGGFTEGGLDRGAAWLVRRLPKRTLASALRATKTPWPARETARLAAEIARGLAALEKRSLAAGALSPDGIGLLGDRAALLADALVAAMVGAPRTKADSELSVSPQFTPPAQADGAPWDAAANRYVLGLVVYRLLSGTQPFAGAGLRHALGEAQHREIPPFEAAIAADLPPGLQSFVLRILDRDPAARPKDARAIAETFARFADENHVGPTLVSGEAPRSREARAPRSVEEGARRDRDRDRNRDRDRAPIDRDREDRADGMLRKARPRRASRRFRAWVPVLLPIALGLAIAGASVAELAPAPAAVQHAAKIAWEKPLPDGHTTARDCASCHPRQTAEWRRSVMGHSVKSPLFNALESLVEEQVGRDFDCPNGAGILRKADQRTACRDRNSGFAITGSGGEHWCVNCHSPGENLDAEMPVWQGLAGGDPHSRLPVRDLLAPSAMEGVSCAFCHQVHGPADPRGLYQGNPTWVSTVTGTIFSSRPEDARGQFGIANSGYDLAPADFIFASRGDDPFVPGSPVAHKRAAPASKKYLDSSEFCGSCHDVRLFGTDSLGALRGEHFKRLRNAYSEWVSWTATERRLGKKESSCQDCHMSTFPGVCSPDGTIDDPACPSGTKLSPRDAGTYPSARVAEASSTDAAITTHYLSGVDLPLSREYPEGLVDEDALDLFGVPLSAKRRRDILLRRTFRFEVRSPIVRGGTLEIPLEIENLRAGHRVPAGFSQEREFWVHLKVTDANGRLVYEVGRVDRADEDLHDKIFDRVNTNPDLVDGAGRPEGLFGADVRDGPDHPEWSPRPDLGGTTFRGRGLINFQNGFLRCVTCIGEIGADGSCQPGPGQGVFRADRFADGGYDQDTGECRSNLSGSNAFFETYFPVGALDSTRGLPKAPDAIIDTRSVPPETPLSYTYELDARGARPPFKVEAELDFRAFPPYLIRAFAAYESEQARRGLRPNGPLVDEGMLRRLDVVPIAKATATVK